MYCPIEEAAGDLHEFTTDAAHCYVALNGFSAHLLCMDFTSCHSQPDVSPEELAKKALAEKADLVIASGGDGTVGAVAGVLVNTGDYQTKAATGCTNLQAPCFADCTACTTALKNRAGHMYRQLHALCTMDIYAVCSNTQAALRSHHACRAS